MQFGNSQWPPWPPTQPDQSQSISPVMVQLGQPMNSPPGQGPPGTWPRGMMPPVPTTGGILRSMDGFNGMVLRNVPIKADHFSASPSSYAVRQLETEVKLPGDIIEGVKSEQPEGVSQGRVIDKVKVKAQARPGAYVEQNFNPAQIKQLIDPNFKFPDPPMPPKRPWFPIFTTPWWKFDNPIDNNLVRGTSLMVFIVAMHLYIFAVVLCEECRGNTEVCQYCPQTNIRDFHTSYVWYMQLGIWYDFIIRTLFGMSPLSPFAVIANLMLKILDVPLDMVPSPAKRFSFFLGIILNTVLFLLAFVFNNPFKRGPALALVIFSGLESIGGFCVGCWFFQTFFRMRDRWELRMDYWKTHAKEGNPARPFMESHRSIRAPLFPLSLYDKTTPHHDKGFMYDLVVIGGGSGGLAASKEAARLGAKVAVLDFVKPTPYGSRWGLGGTCVNVGCIPKKLYHTAAIYGHYLHEAGFYGWDKPNHAGVQQSVHGHQCNWERLRENIQEHIKSLNNGYINGLRSAKVEYINARGSFLDAHTLCLDASSPTINCPGPKCTRITARRIIIAVGGRPSYSDIPGAKELCVTSDDIFSLEKAPGKTLVIGASYIALECAGFLTGLGYDTTVMVRSVVLRGFDRDCADRIKDDLTASGTHFIEKCIPVSVESTPDGMRKVTYENAETREKFVDTFETVMFAIGREPLTSMLTDKSMTSSKELNLDAAGVKCASDGKIWVWNERTTAQHIYAVGDIGHGNPELTPVAIKQGLMLAKRIYAQSKVTVNLDHVPTTVFTPLEYGSIGFSEERAKEAFGDKNIEIFHSEFTPLEFTVPHRKSRCYAKLVVNYLDSQRVIGFHYLGPNAGEVTQGFAAAFIGNLTLPEWNTIVGIHPTAAEEMVSLRHTKRSGLDPRKTGC